MLTPEKLNELIIGVDRRLRSLDEIISPLRQIRTELEKLRIYQDKSMQFEIQKLQQHVALLTDEVKKGKTGETNSYEHELQEIRSLLDQNVWPNAVDPERICDSDEKAVERAGSILDFLVAENLRKKCFLDFGCGKGHTLNEARKREARVVVGYDPKNESADPYVFNDFEAVKKNGPYDVILFHDVLDHAVGVDPVFLLFQAKSVLQPKGKIYIRNHPWSSRHGGHLYATKNKAFLHLVFDEIELTRIGGLVCEPNIKVTTPLETYRFWFSQAGLKILHEMPIRESVEDIFSMPSLVHQRIKKHWQDPLKMSQDLEISFVEYILESAELNHQVF